MLFSDVKSALKLFGVLDTTTCIIVRPSKGSYEYFTQGNRVVVCVGQGRKKSPGHPIGHQHISQQVILSSSQQVFPVFIHYDTVVEYMGNYRLLSYKKVISNEGFVYFEYRLSRKNIFTIHPPRMESAVQDVVPTTPTQVPSVTTAYIPYCFPRQTTSY